MLVSATPSPSPLFSSPSMSALGMNGGAALRGASSRAQVLFTPAHPRTEERNLTDASVHPPAQNNTRTHAELQRVPNAAVCVAGLKRCVSNPCFVPGRAPCSRHHRRPVRPRVPVWPCSVSATGDRRRSRDAAGCIDLPTLRRERLIRTPLTHRSYAASASACRVPYVRWRRRLPLQHTAIDGGTLRQTSGSVQRNCAALRRRRRTVPRGIDPSSQNKLSVETKISGAVQGPPD